MLAGLSRSSRYLTAVVAVLIGCAVAAAVAMAIDLHADARERAGHDTRRLAVVLAEQSSRLLAAVNGVLFDIDRRMALSRLNTPAQFRAVMGRDAIYPDLASHVSGLPQVDGIAVLGADGDIVNSSRSWPPPPIAAGDRAYFQAIRDSDAAVRTITEPVISRVTGNRMVFVLWRIAAPDGTFLGVLSAAVRLKYLEDFYAAINLPDGMDISLLRRDGLVLTGSPSGRPLNTTVMPASSAWFPTVAAGGGDYWSPGWLDGQRRLVSVRPVPGFPVVVDVSITRSAIYAIWWRQVAAIAVGTICVSSCLLLLLRALVAQFRRLEAAEGALRKKSVLLETTLTNMDQGLVMVTAEHTVGVFNDRAIHLLDLPREVMREGVLFDVVLDCQRDSGEFTDQGEAFAALVEQRGMVDCPYAYERRRPDGTVLEIRSIPLADGGMVRTYTDITQRTEAEERILHAARHDVLTSLPNRATFTDRLEAAIAGAKIAGTGVAVLFLDLDRFKLVNDTLGHAAGDQLLRQVADRMRTAVRERDTLARVGGDEFALVMPDIRGPEAAVAIAMRMHDSVREPYVLSQGTASVGASIGISCYPGDGGSAEELLHHADLALYRAKAGGRDLCCVFDAGLDTHEHEGRVLETALRLGLQDEQFALVYQPIWDIQVQRIVGAEALVRWHHPLKGIISPADFIPLAERTGLIVELGRWVMETACREAVSWATPISISVNVAPAQLRRPAFVDELRDLLAATALPSSRLKLEITESQLLEETAEMFATLSALRELGVRLSLDDFGTGYSSLSALRSFPISDVKIDRGFTQAMVQDERSRGLVGSILQVCRVLNLECVVEGVETQEQLTLLQSMGCIHAQGYLIGRPEPPATIRRTLWKLAADERQEPPNDLSDALAVTAV